MKLGKIALKIRMANTRFKSFVAGAAELEMAMQATLAVESAFIIPLGESATANNEDNSINQKIIERFGVIMALKMDISQKDKPAILAYDTIYAARLEIFSAILGWQMKEAESLISYRGGSLLGMSGAWLWYQLEFEYMSRVVSGNYPNRIVGIEETNINENDQTPLAEFERLYANFILAPSERIPYDGALPVPDGYPDVLIPDVAQMITKRDPRQGAFTFDYASAFPVYDEDRRF